MDFGGCSTDDKINETLRVLGFHISTNGYLEERFLRFTDVTDLELTAEPAVVDNPGQIVTDFEEKVVKKKNKCVAKSKERLAKLCATIGSLLSPCPESSLFLLPCSIPAFVLTFVPAPMPAFLPAPVPAPIPASFSHPESLVVLLSDCVPTPATVSY